MSRTDLSAAELGRLRDAFDAAIALPPETREQFVRSISDDDARVREELSSLLRSFDASDGYFEKLSRDLVAPVLQAVTGDDEVPLQPGDTISHYEVIEQVARGGMGLVYKARDLRLGRTVALKLLPGRHAAVPAARARLLAEAQAASALDHPNIGVVYEVGDVDSDRPFIAMAWYDGETLRDRISRGALPVPEVSGIAQQLVSALSAAHAAGIVHCDVKPLNVLISKGGVVKLVDFGIAKLLSAEADERSGAGTPAFMSPEQTRGEPVDARTDIWSVGVLLYQALTGTRPFSGGSDSDVVAAIRTAPPADIFTLRPDAPRSLCEAIERCLRKDPAERYQTMDDLGAAIATAGTHQVSSGDGFSGRRILPHRWAIAGIVLLIIGLAAGTSMFLRQPVPAANRPPITVAVLPLVNRDSAGGDEYLISGFTDDLIGTLGTAAGLRVSARTSASALARQGLSVREIGERLGAAAVVEGDAARAADRLTVSMKLTNVADGRILWSRDYNRPVDDAFALHQEASIAIARALDPAGASRRFTVEQRRPTEDRDAYDLYLKGRLSWSRRTRPALEEALAYLRGAVERDPQFGLAYSGMAAVYVNMSNFEYMPSSEALAQADVASARALAIDSSIVDAHSVRGFVLASYGQFAEAEKSFRRAITLNPSYSWTHHYYALLLIMMGRVDEAILQIRSTLALDPMSLPANATLGILLAMKGDYPAARSQYQLSLRLNPDFVVTRHYFGALAAHEGNFAGAISLLEPAATSSPGFPGVLASLAYAYRRAGRPEDGARTLGALTKAVNDDRSRLNLALGHALLGDHDTAFRMMRNAVWDVPTLIELRANPLLAGFRADPRYPQVLAGTGAGMTKTP